MHESWLVNPGAVALRGDGLDVRGDFNCERFHSEGEVCVVGGHVAGRLDLRAARLHNPGESALRASHLVVDADVDCRDGFRCRGELGLLGARIGGLLDLHDSELVNPGRHALDLDGASVTNLALPATQDTPPEGLLILRHTKVGHLDDDWANVRYEAELDGLVYDSLSTKASNVKVRLEWLAEAQPGFVPHGYEQLSDALRRSGCDQDARAVSYEKECRRRKSTGSAGKVWSWFLWGTVGYGYKARRAFGWLASITGVSWLIFSIAKAHNDMIELHRGQPSPHFNALLYSLDSLLPAINLEQRSYWAPSGIAQYYQAASVVAGWILVSVLLGVLTLRIVRK
jgi:hypothetical protein